MFTDGSRLDGGATGYAVVWKTGLNWAGADVHMDAKQEAYDAECTARAHALELAAQRDTTRNGSPSFRTRRQPSRHGSISRLCDELGLASP